MAFNIEFTSEAERDLAAIRPFYRAQILNGIEALLARTPTEVSRSRIKRLRLLDSPAYRLRIEDYRVFYDVDERDMIVTILRILSKENSIQYLADL